MLAYRAGACARSLSHTHSLSHAHPLTPTLSQVTLQGLSFRHIAKGPVLVTHENNDASLTYGPPPTIPKKKSPCPEQKIHQISSPCAPALTHESNDASLTHGPRPSPRQPLSCKNNGPTYVRPVHVLVTHENFDASLTYGLRRSPRKTSSLSLKRPTRTSRFLPRATPSSSYTPFVDPPPPRLSDLRR